MVFIQKSWGEFPLPGESPEVYAFGCLRVWTKTVAGDLWFARQSIEPDTDSQDSTERLPEDTEWSRWAPKGAEKSVRFSPQLPDRPLVVKPEVPFKVAAGAVTKVFVSCPLWVRLDLVGKEESTVVEIPTVILSNTWFGSYTEGELCYWIRSRVRREATEDAERFHLALCPIRIHNSTDEGFTVEKICLRVPALSLFRSGRQFWTDETQVSHRGKSGPSEIRVVGKAPSQAGKAKAVAEPREPLKQKLVARTFSSLKDLPGLGIFSG